MQNISLISAIQVPDRGIGFQNNLLYSIPEDMRHFKEITGQGTVIMGRKTWESLPQKFRPLPNRRNIIITRNNAYTANGAMCYTSLSEALDYAKKFPEAIFIIGGGELYRQALSYADTLYITLITGKKPADTFFPEYAQDFEITEKKSVPINNPYVAQIEFQTLKRKNRAT